MSIDSYRNRTAQLKRDKANLEHALSRDNENIYRIRRDISSIERGITRNTTLSIFQSQKRQIDSKIRQLSSCEKKSAGLEKKIADKVSEITRAIKNIEGAKERENKKKEREDKRRGLNRPFG